MFHACNNNHIFNLMSRHLVASIFVSWCFSHRRSFTAYLVVDDFVAQSVSVISSQEIRCIIFKISPEYFPWFCCRDVLHDVRQYLLCTGSYFCQEAKDVKIKDCQIFNSFNGTGIAVLTNTNHFFVINNVNDARLRRLAEIPGERL